jgi:phage terminase large subunit
MTQVQVELPEKLGQLFNPSRYKVLYGGRGGAKSWGIATALLILGAQKPLSILCAREFQDSMEDSVHKLLVERINDLGLDNFYSVLKKEITGINGTHFAFKGVRHNVSKLKSFEGADICWVEEAANVSKGSWETLIPTIRKAGSEIWISFNPELEDDETYQRFVKNPPSDVIQVPIGWRDNPWFPEVLRKEMLEMKARDPDAWLNVWEGHCQQALQGAVYADELRAATEQGRICKVPYEPAKPVHTFWDLGKRDATAIWMAQVVGFEFRIIDYYESTGKQLEHYVQELQRRPYLWGDDWMPHDAFYDTMHSPKIIADQVRAMGRKVREVPKMSIPSGLNAVRTMFPKCWFDADKCADGLQALRHYQWELSDTIDPRTGQKQKSKEPKHDWSSHAADALKYMAITLTEKAEKKPLKLNQPVYAQSLGWMGK